MKEIKKIVEKILCEQKSVAGSGASCGGGLQICNKHKVTPHIPESINNACYNRITLYWIHLEANVLKAPVGQLPPATILQLVPTHYLIAGPSRQKKVNRTIYYLKIP